jgi:acetyltransferase-like isoleucine patch superfamily enzyme
MPNSVLTHDDHIADIVTLASGVLIGGGVRVDTGAYLGAGCIVREGLTIGASALIGMGSVVTRDVPADEVWVGNPARPLELAEPGAAPAARGATTVPPDAGAGTLDARLREPNQEHS